MSKPKNIHRLFDMVVEEVSLVDRAANQHRFLLIKRSEPMETNEQSGTDAPTPEGSTAEAEDLANLPPENIDFGKDPAGADAPEAGASSTVPQAALDALGELANVVEVLQRGGLVENGATVAEKLRAAAQALGGSAPEAPPAPPGNLAESLGAALGRLEAFTAQLRAPSAPAPQPTPGADESSPAAETPAAPAVDLSGVEQALQQVSGVLGVLQRTVTEQGQRLARVEKNVGQPNSQPVEPESPKPPVDVGWPLDLNRPLDREHVDKAVSFHDI